MATSTSSSSSSSSLLSPLPSPSDDGVLRSLLRLLREISISDASRSAPHRQICSSIARRSKLLAVVFEELLRDGASVGDLSRSASLCLREILIALQRFKSLLADLASRSRMLLLLQADTVAAEFHGLNLDLATLLDIIPIDDLDLSDDVKDLVRLARRQSRRSSPAVDQTEEALRSEVLDLIREIEREIVPERSRLEAIFEKLGLDDSRSCRDEIECLEREIGDRIAEKWTAAMIALVGLVRYAKCVLYGASTPRSESSAGKLPFSDSDPAAPVDFRCPISLDLMRDPVVVATGQTYDRESITRWLGSGHATCPKTGQALAHQDLVPNKALKNLICQWCRENGVPYEGTEPANSNPNAVTANKAALEAARMTATFLVQKLTDSLPTETANRVVHELRQLTKSGSDNRAFVADAGGVPLLIPLLYSTEANLQLNAVTALLNLSILEANKKRIMHVDGAVDALVHVMSAGATWRAKENAAATVLSLSSVHSYRRRLGRKPSVIEQLVELVRTGPATTRKDALAAILGLAGERENIERLVTGGVVAAAVDAATDADVADEAVAVVAALAKRGAAEAVAAADGAVAMLIGVMRRGTEWARESAAAALVVICRRTGLASAIGEVAAAPGIEWVIWELMQTGSERGRRKAAALGRICRRWATAAIEADRTAALSAVTVSPSTTVA